MVHVAMVASMASSIVTRRPTVGVPPGLRSGARALIARLLYDLLLSETAEKQIMASRPAQPFEKAGFAEGKSLDFPSPGLDSSSPGLDFPSPRLGFSFLLLGFSFPRFAQMENSAAAGGLASIPLPWSLAKWGRGTARRAVEGARHKRGGGLADIEGWSSKSKAAALSPSALRS
jgi:hypothetical protein